MENKQTAVEWIVDQMLSEGHKEMWKDMIQQAKKMEKEQLENARPQIVSNCVIKEISDDEIEKAAENYGWRIKTNTFSDAVKANELAESAKQDFIEGAKWYREQLKNK